MQIQSPIIDLCSATQRSHACCCLQEVENTLKGWFAEFHTYLNYDNPALAEKDPEKESPVDAVKAAVCQNINLFMEMNEEEFKEYLQTFVQDVWTLLTTVKQNVGQVQFLQRFNFLRPVVDAAVTSLSACLCC